MPNIKFPLSRTRLGLGLKIIIVVSSVFFVFILTLFLINVSIYKNKLLDDFKKRSFYIAEFVAKSNSSNVWNMDFSNLRSSLDSLLIEKTIQAAYFEIGDSGKGLNQVHVYGINNGVSVDSYSSNLSDTSPLSDSYDLYIKEPIIYNNAQVGSARLYFSSKSIIKDIQNTTLMFISNLIVFLIIFSFVLYFSIRKILLVPMKEIHEMAMGVSGFTTYLSESVSKEKWDRVQDLLNIERDRQISLRSSVRSDEIGDLMHAFLLVLNGFEVVIAELSQYSAQLNLLNSELENRIDERTSQLEKTNFRLTESINALKMTQSQLVQQEKLASIGQLAAGVAHEINNPIGYVGSNLNRIGEYLDDFVSLIVQLEDLVCSVDKDGINKVRQLKDNMDFDFLIEDFPMIVSDCNEGIHRVKEIVQSLKDFSRNADDIAFSDVDINQAIMTTLKVVNNELKYCCEIDLDLKLKSSVPANLGQLHQVISNLLINAAHAIKDTKAHGKISIRTYNLDSFAIIEINDTGGGIPERIHGKVFDPFFTTKPVGKGTGLGLNICYDIIVNKHHGNLTFETTSGVGTTFKIEIPTNHNDH